MKNYQVAVVVGSLRKESFNRAFEPVAERIDELSPFQTVDFPECLFFVSNTPSQPGTSRDEPIQG